VKKKTYMKSSDSLLRLTLGCLAGKCKPEVEGISCDVEDDDDDDDGPESGLFIATPSKSITDSGFFAFFHAISLMLKL